MWLHCSLALITPVFTVADLRVHVSAMEVNLADLMRFVALGGR